MNEKLNRKVTSDFNLMLELEGDAHTQRFSKFTGTEFYDPNEMLLVDADGNEKSAVVLPLLVSYRLEHWLDRQGIEYQIYTEKDAMKQFGVEQVFSDFMPSSWLDDLNSNLVMNMTEHHMILLTCASKTAEELLLTAGRLWNEAYEDLKK